MSDFVLATLIAGSVSLISAILTFIVGVRSVKRSVATSNGLPLGALLETRINRIDTRLEGVERSLSDVRERITFKDDRINALSESQSSIRERLVRIETLENPEIRKPREGHP